MAWLRVDQYTDDEHDVTGWYHWPGTIAEASKRYRELVRRVMWRDGVGISERALGDLVQSERLTWHETLGDLPAGWVERYRSGDCVLWGVAS